LSAAAWNARFAGVEYFYGEAPNAFLASQARRLRPGMRALALADGEGRNGVWLAEQGLDVHAVDFSAMAQAKARKLAARRAVSVDFVQADLLAWDWPQAAFDLVAAIFVQFAGPAERPALFEGMKRALAPGGLLILQGYTPKQVEYGTGGPPCAENMYTEPMLRDAFSDLEVLHLQAHEGHIAEGTGHLGHSALIDLVACRA
jgi:cyclopropane fatty-acyl-phospholipid synthase-like methyltransferase